MSRVTLSSENTTVLIGSNPAYKTSDETGVLFGGVQTASFSLPQTRQTRKQLGSCYYAVDDLVRHPDINLEINYLYSPTMANERLLGLNINTEFIEEGPITASGDFISGVDDQSYNFYFYNHPEKGIDALDYLTSDEVDTPNTGEIICFGNAYLTQYSLSFANRALPTAAVSFKCCNMKAENYIGDIQTPAINLSAGNDRWGGNLDVSETVSVEADFYGPTIDLDLKEPITSRPGDLILQLQDLQVGGQDISGDHIIQSLSINFPIERVDLHGLGSDYVRGRKMQYPVRGNLSIASLVSKYETGIISGLLKNESTYDFIVTAQSCNKEISSKFEFDDLKLETFDYSMTVNEDMQYSATFSFSMDNK